jgi:hypothetical protein
MLVCLGRTADAQHTHRACRERTIEHELDRADRLTARNSTLALLHLRALSERCPTPRTEGALALALVAARQWREAYERLTHVLTTANDEWVIAQRVVVENARAQCVEHLPRLSPQTNVPGAVLRVNGTDVGTLPLAQPHVLATGAAAIELTSDGYVPIRRTVSLAEGEVFREMLTLVHAQAPQESAPPPSRAVATPQTNADPTGVVVADHTQVPIPRLLSSTSTGVRTLPAPRSDGTPHWVPWTLFGTGIAGIAAGAVLWGAREQAIGTCVILGERIDCPTAEAAQSARGANELGTAALSVGAVGVVLSTVGGIWLLARALSGPRTAPALTVAGYGNSHRFIVGIGGAL